MKGVRGKAPSLFLAPPFTQIGLPKKFCLQKFFGKRRKREAHLLFALCANSVKRSDFRRKGGAGGTLAVPTEGVHLILSPSASPKGFGTSPFGPVGQKGEARREVGMTE